MTSFYITKIKHKDNQLDINFNILFEYGNFKIRLSQRIFVTDLENYIHGCPACNTEIAYTVGHLIRHSSLRDNPIIIKKLEIVPANFARIEGRFLGILYKVTNSYNLSAEDVCHIKFYKSGYWDDLGTKVINNCDLNQRLEFIKEASLTNATHYSLHYINYGTDQLLKRGETTTILNMDNSESGFVLDYLTGKVERKI